MCCIGQKICVCFKNFKHNIFHDVMISIQKHILLINFLTITIFYQVMGNKILPLVAASLAISLYLNHQQLQDHFLLD